MFPPLVVFALTRPTTRDCRQWHWSPRRAAGNDSASWTEAAEALTEAAEAHAGNQTAPSTGLSGTRTFCPEGRSHHRG